MVAESTPSPQSTLPAQSSSSIATYRTYANERNESESTRRHVELNDTYWLSADDQAADSRRYTERRKKTVRFDGQESNDWTRWDSERQNSQDSATRDSGIDTSSTFTSSEDSNRGDGPKVSRFI